VRCADWSSRERCLSPPRSIRCHRPDPCRRFS
jgi:hypothetical protein